MRIAALLQWDETNQSMRYGEQVRSTRGFKPRKDQILRIEGPGGTARRPVAPGVLALDPELSWSTIVRQGIDEWLKLWDSGALQQRQVDQSPSPPPPPAELQRRTPPLSKIAHRAEHEPLAQGHQSAGSGPELPVLIRAWMHRHNLRSLVAAADKLGVPYHTFRSWSLGVRRPPGFMLQALHARLLE